MFYDNFRQACSQKGTTLTTVLRALGRSTGSTGRWSGGSYPTLDVVMEIAEYLGISLDELVYGNSSERMSLSDSDREWLDIISGIPKDKQQMCKDFLRTHVAVRESRDSRRA